MPTQMPFPGGWIPPDELEIDLPDGRRIVVPGRTREQQAIQDAFEGSLTQFRSYGTFLADIPDRVILHELEIKATGGLCLRPHQMTGSCWPGNTPVRMADGSEKEIRDIKAGDWVISHLGQSRKVIGVQGKLTRERMVVVRAKGAFSEILCTEGHMLAVESGTDIHWVKARDLQQGDCVLFGMHNQIRETVRQSIDVRSMLPEAMDIDAVASQKWSYGAGCESQDVSATHRRTSAVIAELRKRDLVGRQRLHLNKSRLAHTIPASIEVTPQLARLIGLYLAEGSLDKHRVCWSINARESQLVEFIVSACKDIFGVDPACRDGANDVTHVRLSGVAYQRLFKALCPGVATTKRVPPLFFSSALDVREHLFSGWMDGDGHFKGEVMGLTSSFGLARDMVTIAHSIGLTCRSTVRPACGHSKPSVRLGFNRLQAGLAMQSSIRMARHAKGVKPRPYNLLGNACPVESVEFSKKPDSLVWDIEVEHDHSFIANGFSAHNCVGVAGARSYCHAMCGDLIHRGDMERVELPFPFATYGWGRSYWTNRKGDGSYGGAQSRAVQEFGMLPRDSQFVPEPARVQGGWISWTSGQEYTWSHPDYWPASKGEVSDEAANYRIETVTRCRDTEEVVQLLAQGYGVTQASNWGTRACRVDGDVLMGPHNGSWAHQMSVSGYWRHPSHGLIFLIDNQWNDYHGTCPTLRTIQDPITGLYPNGSFWITEESMEYMLKSEVYGHSNTMGFPQRDIWNNMGL